METAVTIPDSLFRQAEEMAAALGISRSDLYAAALAEFIRDRRVTERLNEVYENNDSDLDTVIERLQAVSLPAERW
jgi:metal-responsive CopG/Arc/MetJ family transcriptional regulator